METMAHIVESPEGQLALFVGIYAFAGILWWEIRNSRTILHERINKLKGEVSEVKDDLHDHETQCEGRWGKISTKLEIPD